jgi:DNA-binding IclR family transcriptional regulator
VATERTSPPTRRVVAVLNLLADDPATPRTLTAVASTAGLSPATCLGILNELSEAGYVVRHPDRTYSLGGALVSLGAAARDGRPGIDRARRELRELSTELGRFCTASSVIGDEIVVLDTAGPARDGLPFVQPGSRFPFLAPVGLVNAAWCSDAEIASWIERAPIDLGRTKRARMRSVIASCRRHGVAVERLTNAETSLHQILPLALRSVSGEATRRALSEALLVFADRDYLVEELDRPGSSSVSVICAPCFDAGGHPELILAVYVMEAAVKHTAVRSMATRLRRAADAVTASMGGHDPFTHA